MRIRSAVLAFAVALAAPFIHAQTTTYTVPSVNCGPYNPATYRCPSMQVAKADGSAYSFFYEPFYNGQLDYVGFNGLDGLGLMHVTTVTTLFDGSIYHQTTTFTGADSNGVTVNGSVAITFYTYLGYHSGRGAGWRTYWQVIGGNVSVTRVNY